MQLVKSVVLTSCFHAPIILPINSRFLEQSRDYFALEKQICFPESSFSTLHVPSASHSRRSREKNSWLILISFRFVERAYKRVNILMERGESNFYREVFFFLSKRELRFGNKKTFGFLSNVQRVQISNRQFIKFLDREISRRPNYRIFGHRNSRILRFPSI